VHKPSVVLRLERRLADLGCPAQQRERRAREIADHYEDLKRAGLEEGLSEAAAEARANELLGEPVAIAEQLAVVLRRSSWWGRHRIIGFCLLPPIGVFAASVLGLFLVLGCLRLCFSTSEWRVLADQGPGFRLLVFGVELANYAATAGTSLLFCWLAQRSISGVRWAMLACAVCSLQSYFGYCRIAPHSVTIGYSLSPDWICVLIPLLIAGAIWARQARTLKRLGSPPDERPNVSPDSFLGSGPNLNWWNQLIAYPTYWIAAICLLALTCLVLILWVEVERGWAQIKTNGTSQARAWPIQHTVGEPNFRADDFTPVQSRSYSAAGAASPSKDVTAPATTSDVTNRDVDILDSFPPMGLTKPIRFRRAPRIAPVPRRKARGALVLGALHVLDCRGSMVKRIRTAGLPLPNRP